MKFLLDQSADFRLIPHLRQRGHDVQVISRQYPPGLPDADVLAIAREEQRILIVADLISVSLSFTTALPMLASFSSDFLVHLCRSKSNSSRRC
jgi:predicted nuclease of predicted toxin-antitoxin system